MGLELRHFRHSSSFSTMFTICASDIAQALAYSLTARDGGNLHITGREEKNLILSNTDFNNETETEAFVNWCIEFHDAQRALWDLECLSLEKSILWAFFCSSFSVFIHCVYSGYAGQTCDLSMRHGLRKLSPRTLRKTCAWLPGPELKRRSKPWNLQTLKGGNIGEHRQNWRTSLRTSPSRRKRPPQRESRKRRGRGACELSQLT